MTKKIGADVDFSDAEPDMLVEALRFASQGIRIFPTSGKVPFPGTHGLLDATSDSAEVAAWWKTRPEAGIAVATGMGVVVLDVDVKSVDGRQSLKDLEAKYGPLPKTVATNTHGGGIHFYFRTKSVVKNSVNKIGPGLDIRGDGGYVIAPPSKHPAGGRYSWEPGCSLFETEVAQMPLWLEQLCAEPLNSNVVDLNEGLDEKGQIREGQGRNVFLFRKASSLRARALWPDAIRSAIHIENQHRCNPPLDIKEVDALLDSVIGRYAEGNSEPVIDIAKANSFAEALENYRKQMERAPKQENDDFRDMRPKYVYSSDLFQATEAGLYALHAHDNVFANPVGQIVEVQPTHSGLTALPMSSSTIKVALSKMARWCKRSINKTTGEEQLQENYPPDDMCRALAKSRYVGRLKPLNGFSSIPILTPAGELLTNDGYDSRTGMYIKIQSGLNAISLPNKVTSEDVAAALSKLNEPVAEFPFKTPRDKSAWMAALLAATCRNLYSGPTPLVLIRANAPGTGKGLLCNVISRIVSGVPMGAKVWGGAEEMSKLILGSIIQGDKFILFDDMKKDFGGALLDSLLTSGMFSGRVLGTTNSADVPMTSIIFMTGNMIGPISDTARRVMFVELETDSENPENNAHSIRSLEDWVTTNRSELLRSVLVLAKNYIQNRMSGIIPPSLKDWGSFHGFSHFARVALVEAGMEDPYTEPKMEENPELVAIRTLLESMSEAFTVPVGPTHIQRVCEDHLSRLMDDPAKYEADPFVRMAGALEALGEVRFVNMTSHAINNILRKISGRWVGGMALKTIAVSARGVKWWVINNSRPKSEE